MMRHHLNIKNRLDKAKRLCYNESNPSTRGVRQGFTILEFSMAVAFIAVLVITIAIITNNIIAIYQKGLTLKAVNSVGRGLVEELTESINAAPSVDATSLCNSHLNDASRDACEKDRAGKFIYQQKTGTYTRAANRGGETYTGVQMGGVFCTGKFTYVWNTYYGLDSGQSISLKYQTSAGEQTKSGFGLMRIKDPGYAACTSLVDKDYKALLAQSSAATPATSYTVDATKLSTGTANIIPEPEDKFLVTSDADLRLYELTIFPISQDQITLRTFVSGTFILATARGNVNIQRTGDYCDINNLDKTVDNASNLLNLGAEFNYCGINRFNFAARTAGM